MGRMAGLWPGMAGYGGYGRVWKSGKFKINYFVLLSVALYVLYYFFSFCSAQAKITLCYFRRYVANPQAVVHTTDDDELPFVVSQCFNG